MNSVVLLLVAAVLTVSTVHGCNTAKLTACTVAHGSSLEARRIADAINSNYQLSCTYLNNWYECISGNYEDCGESSNIKTYNKHYNRLREDPYNCDNIKSNGVSVAASVVVMTVAVLTRILA